MKTTKWSVLIALAFLLVFVAGVKAADQRWLMAQEESGIIQQGSEEMVPATPAPEQGNEEIAPATPAPEQGNEEMAPATSAPEQGNEEMAPANPTPQEE